MSEEKQASFEGWAKVEVMGHQSHIGFVRTEAYGQAVMFRIDTPELPEREYTLTRPEYVAGSWTPAGAKVQRGKTEGVTVLVGAGSIYRICPCSEAAAMTAIEQNGRAEMKLIELPASKSLAAAAESRDYTCCEGNPEEGHNDDCVNYSRHPDDSDEDDHPDDSDEDEKAL